ncbi:MAG: M23 family metallopeptidase [Melioribacteraceae bacterium]|nr:M23 family metallopeptidase [Melioribacteraceae bacterium]MCF8263214.1 M23 family metallopeptidase [Melioribacteraceae bacterium]MCF8412725.1 M23 family metallopeptidase [Melioribacteraceae bacterium]MCF8431201.1 M23 family metallopeptidase [Melioribacteraceae bacterium]
MIKLLFVSLIFISNNLFSQDLELVGEPVQGGLIIGFAPGVESILVDSVNIQHDANGYFTFAIDRDDSTNSILKVKYKSGEVKLRKIEIITRQFDIQRINNLNQKFVEPPEEEQIRIEKERELLILARQKKAGLDSAYFMSGFTIPVKNSRINGRFGSQRILNGIPKNVHNGIDLSGWMGRPVFASADGIVRIAGENFYYNGNFILLDHGQGLESFYLHLDEMLVDDGDYVKKGDLIGKMGSTGRSTGPHLHWGIMWNKKRIDPEVVLRLDFSKISTLN